MDLKPSFFAAALPAYTGNEIFNRNRMAVSPCALEDYSASWFLKGTVLATAGGRDSVGKRVLPGVLEEPFRWYADKTNQVNIIVD